jgi:hypothetical protein
MFMQHFMHGLGTESAEYLNMTSRGVFVHCTVEEGKSALDRILLVTPLEDLQIKFNKTYSGIRTAKTGQSGLAKRTLRFS